MRAPTAHQIEINSACGQQFSKCLAQGCNCMFINMHYQPGTAVKIAVVAGVLPLKIIRWKWICRQYKYPYLSPAMRFNSYSLVSASNGLRLSTSNFFNAAKAG